MALPNNARSILKCLQNKLTVKNLIRSAHNPPFPGAKTEVTLKLDFTPGQTNTAIPVYQVLDHQGKVADPSQIPKLDNSVLEKMYKDMRVLNLVDKILYDSQRQGRISFYSTNEGEEASHIGSAAALTLDDLIYAQYREMGVLIWRGYPVGSLMDQCYGNVDDKGQGRQMPIHYGSKELNFVTISSPLCTQLPQAVGSAYAFKGKNKVVIGYFGEGAASEGDSQSAFNFAAIFDCPVIFFCRNNGYAISTPSNQQFKGDGIAGRGPAYGVNTIRVDGNDIFAVYNATKKAKEYAIANNKPVLIEALSYRVGHHSTSDDSTMYRTKDEVDLWTKTYDPVSRFRTYLQNNKLWNDEKEKQWIAEAKKNVMTAFQAAEKKLKPSWKELFKDVYHTMPEHIRVQMAGMEKHLEEYKDKYPVQKFGK